MRNRAVEIDTVYGVKMSGQIVPVRIDRKLSRDGWIGTNLTTGRSLRIRNTARFYRCVQPEETVSCAPGSTGRVWYPRTARQAIIRDLAPFSAIIAQLDDGTVLVTYGRVMPRREIPGYIQRVAEHLARLGWSVSYDRTQVQVHKPGYQPPARPPDTGCIRGHRRQHQHLR